MVMINDTGNQFLSLLHSSGMYILYSIFILIKYVCLYILLLYALPLEKNLPYCLHGNAERKRESEIERKETLNEKCDEGRDFEKIYQRHLN